MKTTAAIKSASSVPAYARAADHSPFASDPMTASERATEDFIGKIQDALNSGAFAPVHYDPSKWAR